MPKELTENDTVVFLSFLRNEDRRAGRWWGGIGKIEIGIHDAVPLTNQLTGHQEQQPASHQKTLHPQLQLQNDLLLLSELWLVRVKMDKKTRLRFPQKKTPNDGAIAWRRES